MADTETPVVCSNLNDSNWNEDSWPATTVPDHKKISVTQIKKKYFLDGGRLKGLDYSEKLVYNGHVSHQYTEREVERRAWEIYGGPLGLSARGKQIAQHSRAKWLKGKAASNHKKFTINGQHPQSTEMPTLRVKVNTASSSGHLKKLATTSVLSRSEKFQDLGTIEISSDEEVSYTLASQRRHPDHFHQPSSPTIVGSSPIWKGKKRSEDVLEISSDEGDNLKRPMKKEKLSNAQSVLVLSD